MGAMLSCPCKFVRYMAAKRIGTPGQPPALAPLRSLQLLVCSLLLLIPLQLPAADPLDTVRAEIDSARKELVAIEASPGLALGAPLSATPEQLQQRRFILRETVRAYEQLLQNRTRIESLGKQVEAARKQSNAWQGHDGPPPYSVLFHDRLVEEAEAAGQKLKAINAQVATLEVIQESLGSKLKETAAAIRAAESSAQNEDVAGKWALVLLRLRSRGEEAVLGATTSSMEVARLEAALAEIGLSLAERKVASAGSDLIFTEADFGKVREALKTQSQALVAGKTILPIPGRLPATRTDKTSPPAVEDSAYADNSLTDAMRYTAAILEMKRVLWDLRYRLYNQRSPALLAEAIAQHRQMTDKLNVLLPFLDDQLEAANRQTMQLEAGAKNASDPDQARQQHQQLQAANQLQHYLRQLDAYAESTKFQLARLGAELKVSESALGLTERLLVAAAKAGKAARHVWSFEVFSAEDTIEVDGRKITGVTSITVGKITRATFLFLAGVLFTYWIGRAMERLAVWRFGYNQARARILRKWLFALGLVALVVIVLLWVNIPLTVFAFLGGAIAIGLGFGMQNLLKNLISGLMLLFEQPFKPGDLVQVGDSKGRITEIGIRSSSLRDENGIETLIPNSVFIEDKVTNWMYSNPKVRFCIRLGVAYGTPARELKDLLENCVQRHGLVLDTPPPEVLFQDFGADALLFAIYYWVEMVPKTRGEQIASDLRFMIEKDLAERRIVISFPQRDVHLDAAAPLRVELVKNRDA